MSLLKSNKWRSGWPNQKCWIPVLNLERMKQNLFYLNWLRKFWSFKTKFNTSLGVFFQPFKELFETFETGQVEVSHCILWLEHRIAPIWNNWIYTKVQIKLFCSNFKTKYKFIFSLECLKPFAFKMFYTLSELMKVLQQKYILGIISHPWRTPKLLRKSKEQLILKG